MNFNTVAKKWCSESWYVVVIAIAWYLTWHQYVCPHGDHHFVVAFLSHSKQTPELYLNLLHVTHEILDIVPPFLSWMYVVCENISDTNLSCSLCADKNAIIRVFFLKQGFVRILPEWRSQDCCLANPLQFGIHNHPATLYYMLRGCLLPLNLAQFIKETKKR